MYRVKVEKLSIKSCIHSSSNSSKYLEALLRGSFINPEGLELDEIHNRLEKSFDMGCLFNADQAGVPEVFLFNDEEYSLNADDHCFHEYDSVEAIDASREDIDLQSRSIGEFVTDVENFSRKGWAVFDPWEKSFSTSIFNRFPGHPNP